MGIALSLKEIDESYEYFFTKPPPKDMSFENKLRILINEIGIPKLQERRRKNEQGHFQQVVPVTPPESQHSPH